jgi:antirestriction protein ArdC
MLLFVCGEVRTETPICCQFGGLVMPQTSTRRTAPSSRPEPHRDIYATITSKIIAAIEANPGEPVLPWHRGGFQPTIPTNAATGNDYRGVNILSLWITALERGYQRGTFATYKQWAALGAQVRKGESVTPIVFYREIERTRDTQKNSHERSPRDDPYGARLLGVCRRTS